MHWDLESLVADLLCVAGRVGDRGGSRAKDRGGDGDGWWGGDRGGSRARERAHGPGGVGMGTRGSPWRRGQERGFWTETRREGGRPRGQGEAVCERGLLDEGHIGRRTHRLHLAMT